MTTTEEKLIEVLNKAWMGGIAVQSQFFRDNPSYVALAASEGLITTILTRDSFGGIWRITPRGCARLFETTQSVKDDNKEII